MCVYVCVRVYVYMCVCACVRVRAIKRSFYRSAFILPLSGHLTAQRSYYRLLRFSLASKGFWLKRFLHTPKSRIANRNPRILFAMPQMDLFGKVARLPIEEPNEEAAEEHVGKKKRASSGKDRVTGLGIDGGLRKYFCKFSEKFSVKFSGKGN